MQLPKPINKKKTIMHLTFYFICLLWHYVNGSFSLNKNHSYVYILLVRLGGICCNVFNLCSLKYKLNLKWLLYSNGNAGIAWDSLALICLCSSWMCAGCSSFWSCSPALQTGLQTLWGRIRVCAVQSCVWRWEWLSWRLWWRWMCCCLQYRYAFIHFY